jgi:hypothetical protein
MQNHFLLQLKTIYSIIHFEEKVGGKPIFSVSLFRLARQKLLLTISSSPGEGRN